MLLFFRWQLVILICIYFLFLGFRCFLHYFQIPAHGVSAENELDIAVDFIAPESPGRYISYWRMASPSGQKFGQRVWVLIQVSIFLHCRTGFLISTL